MQRGRHAEMRGDANVVMRLSSFVRLRERIRRCENMSDPLTSAHTDITQELFQLRLGLSGSLSVSPARWAVPDPVHFNN